MAVHRYLDNFGRRVAGSSNFYYDVCLSEQGELSVRYKTRNNTFESKMFLNLKTLTDFLKTQGHFDFDAIKCDLVAYYRASSMVQVNREDATHCILPLAVEFKACTLAKGRIVELFRGDFDKCLFAVKRAICARNPGPRRTASVNDNVVWRDVSGATVPYGARARYKLVQRSSLVWELYDWASNADKVLLRGQMSECMQLINDNYQRETSAAQSALDEESVAKTRTRNAAKAVRVCYYDGRLHALGDMLSTDARYKVYLTDSNVWRVAKRSMGEGRFTWVNSLEFVDEDSALGFLYLYADSVTLDFFTVDWTSSEFASAKYCKRVRSSDQLMEIHKFDGVSWDVLITGNPVELINFREEDLHRKEITTSAPTTSQESLTGKPVPVQNVVWSHVKDTTHIIEKDLASYLVVCAVRNRFCGKTPVFNTRLYDSISQPIYMVDTGWKAEGPQNTRGVTLGQLKLCMSLAEAQRAFPDIQSMPLPLQWSDNMADYLWNPTIPLAPITQHAFEHICDENYDRIPSELQKLQPSRFMAAIRQSAIEGAEMACRNPFFALPLYSVEHDRVDIMLPVKVPLLFDDKVIAALVLTKMQTGYRVSTLITPAMARRSCSLFCDPRNTWLKEC